MYNTYYSLLNRKERKVFKDMWWWKKNYSFWSNGSEQSFKSSLSKTSHQLLKCQECGLNLQERVQSWEKSDKKKEESEKAKVN
jgi:hypothetical protein